MNTYVVVASGHALEGPRRYDIAAESAQAAAAEAARRYGKDPLIGLEAEDITVEVDGIVV